MLAFALNAENTGDILNVLLEFDKSARSRSRRNRTDARAFEAEELCRGVAGRIATTA